jgi:molecular chaperone GrpE
VTDPKQKHMSNEDAANPEVARKANGAAPADEADLLEVSEIEQADIDALIAERDQYLDQLQRSVAEFANYRRRIEQERDRERQFANRLLLMNIVPVLDDLQRALDAAADGDAPWVQGVRNVERKLVSVLERAGVTPLEALGQPFDPALHEAVATEPGSSGSTVVDVYQTGYRLGESLLRPAMVKVGDAAR